MPRFKDAVSIRHLILPIPARQDGEQFWKMDECYVRGNMIKYIRVAEDVIDSVKAQEVEARQRREAQSSRGGHGGGRGRDDRGRGGRFSYHAR